MKAIISGKFIALNTDIKNSERSHTSDFTAHLKAQEQKEAVTHKVSRQQEIIKLKIEMYKEAKRTIQRVNKTASWLFKNTNRIDKPLS